MTVSESTFDTPPFPAFPSISRYVPLGTLEESRTRVSRSIDAFEGLSLIIGPPGTGKSLLCALLSDMYRESHRVVTLGNTPIADAAALGRYVLHHLGVDLDEVPNGDLDLAFVNRVSELRSQGKGVLILVDEAQSLSAEVLEAIRIMTNIMLDGQPSVYAVVLGGVKLEDTLVKSEMEPFTQRIATRCYLHPLSAQETREYIAQSIRRCGAEPEDSVTDAAMATIHHACDGVPRLINQLLTCAIDVAADADEEIIGESTVDRAWAELQQLPSPMIEEPVIGNASTPIEFGELDENEHTDVVDESVTDTDSLRGLDEESEQEDELTLETSEPSPEIIQETSDISQSTTPPPSKLFGDFEDEEEVAVGRGIASTDESRHQPSMDLESMLHSEIVGIANAASDASSYEEEVIEAAPEHNASTEDAEREPAPTSDSPAIWFDEPTAETRSVPDDTDIVVHDDSYMLVVEDDVDAKQHSTSTRIDSDEQHVAVDFHAMLSRMRSGVSSAESSCG